MLVFRILATVFVAMSCITGFCKNILSLRNGEEYYVKAIFGASLWGFIWRAFVIVAIWIV